MVAGTARVVSRAVSRRGSVAETFERAQPRLIEPMFDCAEQHTVGAGRGDRELGHRHQQTSCKIVANDWHEQGAIASDTAGKYDECRVENRHDRRKRPCELMRFLGRAFERAAIARMRGGEHIFGTRGMQTEPVRVRDDALCRSANFEEPAMARGRRRVVVRRRGR